MSQELSFSKFHIVEPAENSTACTEFDWNEVKDLSFTSINERQQQSSPIPTCSQINQEKLNVSCHSSCSCLKGVEFDPDCSLERQQHHTSHNSSWVPESVGVFSAQTLEDAFRSLETSLDTDDSFRIQYRKSTRLPHLETIKYLRRKNLLLRNAVRRHQSSLKELRKTLQETNIVVERIFKLMDTYVNCLQL
jgi:hypothetical protein